jgi:hypothetical protein
MAGAVRGSGSFDPGGDPTTGRLEHLAARGITVGRRSGKEWIAILGYYADGPNLVTLAMNGWAEA